MRCDAPLRQSAFIVFDTYADAPTTCACRMMNVGELVETSVTWRSVVTVTAAAAAALVGTLRHTLFVDVGVPTRA